MSGEAGEKKDEGVGVDTCLLSALERIGVGLVAGFLGSMMVRRRWPIVLGLGFAVGQGIGDCREDLCGDQCLADREAKRKSEQKEQDQNEENQKKEEEQKEQEPKGNERRGGGREKTDQGKKEEEHQKIEYEKIDIPEPMQKTTTG